MRAPVHRRSVRLLAALGVTAALLMPTAALPARAASPLILRVGTTQDLDALNPYQTLLVSGYEVFQLTYNLLVDFGPNLEPVPGFADSWTRAADGNRVARSPDRPASEPKMTRLHQQIETRLPLDAAFAFVADFANATRWDPGVATSEPVDDRPVGLGARYRLGVRMRGRVTLME